MRAGSLPAGVVPLLTTEQAAEYLAISPATLQTYRTRGGGPVATMVARHVRYRIEDLDAWTTRQDRTPVPVVRTSPRSKSKPAAPAAGLRSVS